jgi:hypothetical protein
MVAVSVRDSKRDLSLIRWQNEDDSGDLVDSHRLHDMGSKTVWKSGEETNLRQKSDVKLPIDR